MKIRLVSDLHVDVNRQILKAENFDFSEDVDLTLIAGDIAGSYQAEKEFLKDKTNFVAVGGNHLGYDYLDNMDRIYNPYFGSKSHSISTLREQDTENHRYYLENEYIEFEDYVIFGGTMYTDFKLFGNKSKNICKKTAQNWMNDFRYVYEDGEPITPEHYEKWNSTFKRKLKKCLEKTDKYMPVIVLTHFCPSSHSLTGRYYTPPTLKDPGWYLNAAYVSDMEKFILDNPRIKYWLSGHTHSYSEYYIGQCHCITAPYGYYGREAVLPGDYTGKIINIR